MKAKEEVERDYEVNYKVELYFKYMSSFFIFSHATIEYLGYLPLI